jgi:hypothetical protein
MSTPARSTTALATTPPVVSVDDFRVRFPEFASNSDEQVDVALDDALPWNGYAAWGTSYVKGVTTLAAHFLALSNQRAAKANADGTTRPATGIFSYPTMRKAGAPTTQYGASGAGSSSGGSGKTPDYLALTSYGQEWYAMARIKGMGAVALGGWLCGGCPGDEAFR